MASVLSTLQGAQRSNRILFARAAELFAVPFDLGTLTVSGTQERVLEDATTMQFGGTVSIPLLAIDDDGSIAYAGVQRGGVGSIVRIDTRGRLTALPSAPASYSSPRISSDGSRIAVSIAGDDRRSDIWIIDSVRGTRIRLTSQGGTSPAWSADGREMIFTTSGFSNETYGALARMPSDGSGAPKLVVVAPGDSSQQLRAIGSWGGTTMVFARLAGVRGRLHSDLFQVVEGKDPVAILATPADERTPGVSPDGKWCAYVSNASGRDEIYVKNLSAAAAMIPVSAAGGVQPVWARDGRSLYFREADRLMRAAFDGSTGRMGNSTFIRDLPRDAFGNSIETADYDVAADGSLIAIQRGATIADVSLTVILNWGRTLSRSR